MAREPLQPASPEPPDAGRRPLHFGIGSLLGLMTAVALFFGTLRWLGVSTAASMIILLILAVAAVAAVLLLIAIANMPEDDG